LRTYRKLVLPLEDGMNIRIKQAMMAAGIATAMALPLSSQASDGTLTFTGAVTANSCTLTVNGVAGADATIALPTVDTAALSNSAPRTTAAGTFFSIAVSACTALTDIGGTTAPASVQIYFEAGPNVDQATGGLINKAASGSNVEVNLFNATSATVVGQQIIPGTGMGAGTHQPAVQPVGSLGTQWFYAQYSTAGAGAQATAGAVSTSITYSLIYQ
jgi:major type 1 subunit fimbrin (pilin)